MRDVWARGRIPAGFLCITDCQAFKQLIYDYFLWLHCDSTSGEHMVYKILSPLSHITVISAKVKFYRLSITLLPSVCLMCLEIWNLKINRLILAPKNICPFKECKPCAQDGEPCFGMWLFRKDLRFMGENQSYWGMSNWALSKALCCHNPYKFKWESQVGAGEYVPLSQECPLLVSHPHLSTHWEEC